MGETTGDKIKRFAAMRREKGLLATTCYACSRILPRVMWLLEDRVLWGALARRTRKGVPASELAIEGPNQIFANRYEAVPTPALVMWLIRKVLPVDRSTWTFVDVGAGKGRAVAAAATQGFRSSIGIELARDLCTEANSLLADLGFCDGSGRVRVDQADATDFPIPPGPCVFFLFNPFQESVVSQFVDHVMASYAREPRPIRFVYLNPVWKSRFEQRLELRPVKLPTIISTVFSTLSPYSVCVFEVSG